MLANGTPEIYFACSIRGGREDAAAYDQIVDYIKTKAHVLTEIFASGTLTSAGMNKPIREIWHTDVNWIRQSDAVIAEVSTPSLGVGYEIGLAGQLHKPVLALFHDTGERKLSAMIDGSPIVSVARYTEVTQLHDRIDRFIQSLARTSPSVPPSTL